MRSWKCSATRPLLKDIWDGMSTRDHKKRVLLTGGRRYSPRDGTEWIKQRSRQKIEMARNGLGIWSAPSARGRCWILLPGYWVQPGEFLGSVVHTKGSESSYVWIIHPQGSSSAIQLRNALRLFTTEDDVESVRRWVTKEK